MYREPIKPPPTKLALNNTTESNQTFASFVTYTPPNINITPASFSKHISANLFSLLLAFIPIRSEERSNTHPATHTQTQQKDTAGRYTRKPATS